MTPTNYNVRMSKEVAIIKAPSSLGLQKTGVEGLADALLAAGLAKQLSAKEILEVAPLPNKVKCNRETGLLNIEDIAEFSRRLANAVNDLLTEEKFPFVLGGDCSILLGSLLALRRRGRFGLFFADGHADFYQPKANVNGEVASSELALATGRGPSILTRLEGFDRLIQDEDVVVFGYRDEEEQRQYGSQLLPPSLLALNLAQVRRLGVKEATEEAIEFLNKRGLEGFWLHIDADVMADSIMPAVDYRLPDGLSWAELITMLQTILSSRRLMGLEVTIYNPQLDPTRHAGKELASAIARGFLTMVGEP